MPTKTKLDLAGLITEARHVYETEPVAAALILYQGVSAIDQPKPSHAGHPEWQGMPPTYGENTLRAAVWTLQVMAEDAQAGIAPTHAEWHMHLAVAESIARMTEASHVAT